MRLLENGDTTFEIQQTRFYTLAVSAHMAITPEVRVTITGTTYKRMRKARLKTDWTPEQFDAKVAEFKEMARQEAFRLELERLRDINDTVRPARDRGIHRTDRCREVRV